MDAISSHPIAASAVAALDDVAARIPLAARLRAPRTWLSFGIAAAIVAFVVTRIDLDLAAVGDVLASANPLYLGLGLLAYYAAFPLRAARWARILASAGIDRDAGYSVPARRGLTEIVVLGQFVNCIAPAKLGDGYRGYLLKKQAGVSFPRTLGTILAERLVDLVVLTLFLIMSGMYVFNGSAPADVRPWFMAGGALALCGVGTVVLAAVFSGRILPRVPARVRGQATALEQGLVTAFSRERIHAVGLISIPIWLLEGVRVLCIARAVDIGLPFVACLFVGLLASMLTAFPFTPAGLGAVESGALLALAALGVGSASAGALVLLDRGIAYWSLLLVGGIVYLFSKLK